eukprot:GHVS01105425.1.p1 GENE.GHVS01105425.1~~GHVS01105425.1.p1  ORF type:complete len:313 (-),score=41.57 GHVS01105425.1:2649-3587(-)
MEGSAPSSLTLSPILPSTAASIHATRMLCSGVAGVLEICTFYPCDTIGKRLMYDRTLHTADSFRELLLSYRQTIFLVPPNHSGVVRSLYAGFKYAAIYKVGQRAYQFGTQPIFKEMLRDRWKDSGQENIRHGWGEVLLSASAGALMGIGELIFVPVSVLKIRAQTHPGCFKGRSLYSIWKAEPTSVLWRGWTWTLARNVPGSFGLFGGDEIARQYLFTNHQSSLWQHFGSTFAGAVCSLMMASPFDVIKTRMQGGRFGSSESGVQILRKLLAAEGAGSLFKGCVAKLLTVGPKLAYGMGCATYMSGRFVDSR